MRNMPYYYTRYITVLKLYELSVLLLVHKLINYKDKLPNPFEIFVSNTYACVGKWFACVGGGCEGIAWNRIWIWDKGPV